MSHPVFRFGYVARADSDSENWVYLREWRCLNHPMDGIRLVAELTNSARLRERAALKQAEKLKVGEALDEQILNVWEPPSEAEQ